MQYHAQLPASAMVGLPVGRQPQSTGRHTSSEAWNWNPIPANASQVAIAPDGTLWALATNGPNATDKYIWHYAGGGWVNLPGAYGVQIAIAPDGSLWDVTAGGGVWHYLNGAWSSIGGAVSSITVDRSGNVWATATSNQYVWEYSNGFWHNQPSYGFGVRVASNPDNSLYVLSSGGAIWDFVSFAGYFLCKGSGAVDITPKPGGLGFYILSGLAGGQYQIWDFTSGAPGDCRNGSYNATGWTATGVSALGNTLAVISQGNIFTTIANMPSCSVPPTTVGFVPCDLQAAYNLPSTTAGVGQTVAIVDAYDDPNAESDLTYYRSYFGLPSCTTANGCFRKVSQTGTTSYPAASAHWAEEISLDLDMVSAICPNCHILLVEANSNSGLDLAKSVAEAVTLGATEVSGSFGGGESSSQTSLDTYFNHPGVPIVVSAGDAGYGAQYPATSPYVVAAGGTTLIPSSSLRGWSETAWGFTYNSGGASFRGTGSGCSAYEPKPSWQNDGGCTTRVEADVAAVADLNTGVAVYNTYQANGWASYGGTSVAAPIIASVFALAGGSVGSAPAGYLYSHASQFWNITDGTNGPCPGVAQYLCYAGVGYNGPTGLGTPNGLGAFGGVSIAATRRAPLSEADRVRLARSYDANPTIVPACPAAQPGYMQCHALIRVGGSTRSPL
jgi:hypothetical protein